MENEAENTIKKIVHDSWVKGGTLITNFDKQKGVKYMLAIQLLQSKVPNHGLIISPDAYAKGGHKLNGSYSLHQFGTCDLTEFWSIFDSIEL
jgi:hypothetical protein